jgi:4-amino-4-deoxy-L-arabinose transferase-like glycosyltransferase
MRRLAAAATLLVLCLLVLAGGLRLRQRIGAGWTGLGADSFAYIGAAKELYQNHRYAFRLPDWYPLADRQQPLPPGYGRLPAYPALLAVTTRPVGVPYEVIYSRGKAVQHVIDLGTCVLVGLIAWRLRGRRAGIVGLILAAASPQLGFYASTLLTETLATFLTMLTLWLWVEGLSAARGSPWEVRFLGLGGVAMGLAVLCRIDSLLLLGCLLIPLLLGRPGLRRGVGLALLALLLTYGPWLVRNTVVLGRPYVLAARATDVLGREMPRAAFFSWFATWIVDEEDQRSTLWCFFRPSCVSTIYSYPAEAFDSPAERAEVARLFSERARFGLTPAVDEGFARLAQRRLLAHPLRTLIVLPLRRVYRQFTYPSDQPLRSTAPVLPWPEMTQRLIPHLRVLCVGTTLLAICGFLAAGLPFRRRKRADDERPLPQTQCAMSAAWLLCAAIIVRSGALAVFGYVEVRYMEEVYPALLALCAVAICAGLSAFESLTRRALRRVP